MNALTDPDALVPPVPADVPPGGVAWLRATVARFSNGADHARRRALVVEELDTIPVDLLQEKAREQTARIIDGTLITKIARSIPVCVLAAELGLSDVSADIALVADVYHSNTTPTADDDAAVARLIAACGGRTDESTAARIGLLVQACAATAALIEKAIPLLRQGDAGAIVDKVLETDPPVRQTRRRIRGADVVVPLAGQPFGAGVKKCPGRAHAIALACGILDAVTGDASVSRLC